MRRKAERHSRRSSAGAGSGRDHLKTAVRLAGATLFGQDHELRYTWVQNPAPQFGTTEVIGKTDEEVLRPAAAAVVLPAKRVVLETAKTQRIEYCDRVAGQTRWFDLRIEPELAPDGSVSGLICAGIDITDRMRWEEHQRVLLLELAHRSKNLLAVVQSVANQTGKGTTSVEEFKRRFFGRLYSLSRAHEILSDQNWRGAGLRELIRSQVLIYVGDAVDRIGYDGPPVYLRPNAAQHVGLALHELTTNALKHGALKDHLGEVDIAWTVSHCAAGEEPGLTLRWSEKQDVPVELPAIRSFGRVLLESVVPTAISGEGSLRMGPDGIVYELHIPPDELLERPGSQAAAHLKP